jgi:origin recognition complex subunit 2
MDHVSGPMIFNQQQRVRGNWVRGDLACVSSFASSADVLCTCMQLWCDATTFQQYSSECIHVDGVVKGKSDLTASGLTFVLQSLTPNHRGILKVLAEFQLGQSDSGGGDSEGNSDNDGEGAVPSASKRRRRGAPDVSTRSLGIEFVRLLELCTDKLLVGSDSALRTHLVELKDHKLVTTRRGVDRRELLYIPLSTSQVRQISELDAA